MKDNHSISILLVDDDRLVLSTLATGLSSAGFSVNTAESVDEAEAWLDNNARPDLVILDMNMPERLGIELSEKLTTLGHIPFILLSAYSEKQVVDLVKEAGAISYLVKPVSITQILPAIDTALARATELQNLRKTRAMLQTALDGDRAISVAVGIIMKNNNLSHDDAFNLMRNKARSNHLKLIDVASSIIEASETLNLAPAKKKIKSQ